MGYNASIITLGDCGVGRVDQAVADRYIELALEHCVSMIVVDQEPIFSGLVIKTRDELLSLRLAVAPISLLLHRIFLVQGSHAMSVALD